MNRFLTILLTLLVAVAAFAQFPAAAYGHNPDWRGDYLVTTIGTSISHERIALWSTLPTKTNAGVYVDLGPGRNARFNPSGHLLAFERGTNTVVITTLQGKVISYVVVEGLRGQFSWMSDTKILFPRVIYGSSSRDSIWSYDIITRNYQEVWHFERGNGPVDVEAIDENPNSWFTASYVGPQKMAISASTQYWLMDAISGVMAKPRFKVSGQMDYILYRKSPTWGESGISILDLATLESRRVADGVSAAWSSDGKTVAVAGTWNDPIRFVPNPF